MRSERLRWLVRTTGPFASVYFDDSHDTAGAAEQLDARWRDIRRSLEELGADARLVGMVERAVLHFRPAVGRRGRVVIATGDQVLVNELLSDPPPVTVVRVSDYPYLEPLIDRETQRPTYVVAAVSRSGADVTLHQGNTISSEIIDGAGYPVHKPASAGWNGYGDRQHSTEEAVRMNCRAVADHLTRLVDEYDPEVVFVCGEARSRGNVIAELPPRVHERVSQLPADARKSHVESDEIRRLTSSEFVRRQHLEADRIIDRFRAEVGRDSGLAAQGLAAVCEALRDGEVETLIVGDLDDTTVVSGEPLTTIAPDADALSELGQPVRRVARADEALPFAAIANGAALVRAHDAAVPADGVGAILRHVAVDRLAAHPL